ncbi:MAG: phosphoribosyltransferase family protein [Candidatus Micrarchaeia archaeon]
MFETRESAGVALANALKRFAKERPVVLAIPRGGIPVAFPVVDALKAEFGIVVSRKLPVPWSPEVGFGALAPDGSVEYNPEVVSMMDLPRAEISRIEKDVLAEIGRRIGKYLGERKLPALRGRTVIIVDDGLATGYTMVAAAKFAKNAGAKKIVVAVPTSSRSAIETVKAKAPVDEVVSLVVSDEYSYAVAMSYKDFHDMKDGEVMEWIEKAYSKSKTA